VESGVELVRGREDGVNLGVVLGGVEHEIASDLERGALNVLSFTLLGDIPC